MERLDGDDMNISPAAPQQHPEQFSKKLLLSLHHQGGWVEEVTSQTPGLYSHHGSTVTNWNDLRTLLLGLRGRSALASVVPTVFRRLETRFIDPVNE